MNDTVVDVEFGKDTKLPITTYTEEDLAIAKEKNSIFDVDLDCNNCCRMYCNYKFVYS